MAMNHRGGSTYFTYSPPMIRIFPAHVRLDGTTDATVAHRSDRVLPLDVRHRSERLEHIETHERALQRA
jgi:hypothetical protein